MSGSTNKKSASEHTRDRLRQRILEGEYAAGEMLPGERDLAEQLGVSRLTLRSALAGLESEGLIEKVHGAGNRVLPFREFAGIEMAGHLARYQLNRGEIPIGLLSDLMEFRRVIAAEVLSIVVSRATPDELRGLRAQVDVLEEAVGDAQRFMEEDLNFARLLVRATHNLAIELLYNTILRVIRSSAAFEMAFAVNSKETVRVYRRLLASVESREPREASKLAVRILTPLDQRTLDRLSELRELGFGSRPVRESALAPRNDGTTDDTTTDDGTTGDMTQAASTPANNKETTR